MFTSQLTSQLTVLASLAATRVGGDQTFALEINEKATDYLDEYYKKVAEGRSTSGLQDSATKWIDETVTSMATQYPVRASAESVFAEMTAGQSGTTAPVDLMDQLEILSTVSGSMVGGNQVLAADLNEDALKFIEDYNKKVAEGRSTANLEEDATKWVAESVTLVALSLARQKLSDELFAADPELEESGQVDLSGQLAVLSNITVEEVGGDQELTDALNQQATEYIVKLDEMIENGDSTENLEAEATEWIQAAIAEAYVSRAVETISNSLAEEGLALINSGSASQAVGTVGSSAWMNFLANQGRTSDTEMRSQAAGLEALNALKSELSGRGFEKFEKLTEDTRLDSMKRALKKLQALPDEVANSYLSSLLAGGETERSVQGNAPIDQGLWSGNSQKGGKQQSDDMFKTDLNAGENSRAAKLGYSATLSVISDR